MHWVGPGWPVLRSGEDGGLVPGPGVPQVLGASRPAPGPLEPVGLGLRVQLGGQLSDVSLAEPGELERDLEEFIWADTEILGM